MPRMGFLRGAAALAVAGAALAASAAPAAAARPRTPMFTPRMLATMAPKGGLLHRMAALLPGAAAPSLASLSLFTDPGDRDGGRRQLPDEPERRQPARPPSTSRRSLRSTSTG